MLQDYTTAGRFCPDCGVDVSAICPTCHGLGYIQPLPLFPSFTVVICDHADERGLYCSKCGTKLQQEPMVVTCSVCMGKGWVPAPYHYCLRKMGPPARR